MSPEGAHTTLFGLPIALQGHFNRDQSQRHVAISLPFHQLLQSVYLAIGQEYQTSPTSNAQLELAKIQLRSCIRLGKKGCKATDRVFVARKSLLQTNHRMREEVCTPP